MKTQLLQKFQCGLSEDEISTNFRALVFRDLAMLVSRIQNLTGIKVENYLKILRNFTDSSLELSTSTMDDLAHGNFTEIVDPDILSISVKCRFMVTSIH